MALFGPSVPCSILPLHVGMLGPRIGVRYAKLGATLVCANYCDKIVSIVSIDYCLYFRYLLYKVS